MVQVEIVITLCLKISLNLFGSSSRCFLHHSNNPSLQSSNKFSLAATSREVGYSAMGLKLPDNIVYGGHRNIKVSRDGLVALRLSMLGYNLRSNLLPIPSIKNYIMMGLLPSPST